MGEVAEPVHSSVSVPFDGGAIVFAVTGRRLRRRTVTVVAGSSPVLRGLTTRRRLLRFAAALEDGALPVRLGDALSIERASGNLPYGVLRWPGGSGRVALASVAAAARSAAG
jgi:hypothetical protein